MKTIVVIPARYKSTRFPGKPLVTILGKPMILWVAELSSKAVGIDNVYIATDDLRISDVAKKSGYHVVMTDANALTGTDRLAEVAKKIDADIYVNVQGDEPLVNPQDIINIINEKKKYIDCVINGYCEIDKSEDIKSVNIPKVIFTEDRRMIYMSRNPLPGFKDKKDEPKEYYKQVCIYAFNREELLKYGDYAKKSYIEGIEDIEILRFIELRKTVRMVKTTSGSLAVDIPDDVNNVEIALKRLNDGIN